MTKPTEKDIREALEWVNKLAFAIDPETLKPANEKLYAIAHTIRTALEECKPKTVTRGEVEAITEKIDYIGWPPSALTDNVIGLLKSTGIEVMGETPDNISKEVNNGS